MTADSSESVESPLGRLERTFIDKFLRARGHNSLTLHALGEADRQALLVEASVYASANLSEVESRSHFVHELHDVRPGHSQSGLD